MHTHAMELDVLLVVPIMLHLEGCTSRLFVKRGTDKCLNATVAFSYDDAPSYQIAV